MELEGVDEAIRNLEEWGADVKVLMAQSFSSEGMAILDEAMDLCPVDEGKLQASLYFEMEIMGPFISGIIGSRGCNYAVYVHENLNIQHPFHEHSSRPGHKPYNCGGQAKFIEVPLLQRAPLIPEHLAEKLRAYSQTMGVK